MFSCIFMCLVWSIIRIMVWSIIQMYLLK
jgi:hypothetical protein